jgi:benzodiazapine receptor
LKTQPPVSYRKDIRPGNFNCGSFGSRCDRLHFTSESVSTWYQTIEKPSFSPPNWLFGPVWTTLYVLMRIPLFLIWRATSTTTFPEDRHGRKIAAFIAFGSQLILNVLWSFLFFGLRSPQLAFAEIVILLISIMVTIVIFYKISRLAAY